MVTAFRNLRLPAGRLIVPKLYVVAFDNANQSLQATAYIFGTTSSEERTKHIGYKNKRCPIRKFVIIRIS